MLVYPLIIFVLTILHQTHAREIPSLSNSPQIKDIQCNRKDATINWRPMGDNGASTLGYTIQYSTSFKPDIWEHMIDTVAPTDTSFNVPLSPWTNYTFRVIASNRNGDSEPSQHSTVCSTSPDVPYKNPDNVEGKGVTPDNLVISWEPMPQIEHNAPRFHYRVLWKLDVPGEDYTSREIFDWQESRIVVENVPSFTQYRIKVVALNEIGEANVPAREVIGYSGENEPLLAPENFTLGQIQSPTAALLSWNPVPPDSVRGHFTGYKIKTWAENKSGHRTIHVQPKVTRALINNFVPFSKNYAQVYVYNDKYDGPSSETLSFDMPEGVPSQISSLEAHRLGSNAFYLEWKKPDQLNGILTGYRIYYAIMNGTSLGELIERKPNVTDPDQLQAKVAGLVPNSRYSLGVTAVTRVGASPKYFIERETKFVELSKPSIPSFSWQRIPTTDGSASIRIIWLPNLTGKPGSYFFVKYKKVGEPSYIETNPEFQLEYLDVRGLELEQTYEFVLIACDDRNLNTPSEPQEILIHSS